MGKDDYELGEREQAELYRRDDRQVIDSGTAKLNYEELQVRPNGDHAYVPCLPGYHHHHVICQSCARVTEVEDLGLGGSITRMEAKTGWKVDKHRLELYGRCPECRAKGA